MIDTKLLQALAAVILEGSFEKAASSLFLTQSAISQRIRQLEEQIGQILVVRSIPVAPTPAGQALLRHYRQLSLLEEALFDELALSKSTEPVTLALAVNADSLDSWFLRSMDHILQEQGIFLHLVLDDQSATHAYLRSGEVQGAITSTPATHQGLKTHLLGDLEYLCVSSPNFHQRYFSQGLTPQNAHKAPAVIFTQKDHLHHEYLEQTLGSSPNFPAHMMPTNTSFLHSILQGYAYGLVPSIQAQELLQNGALVEISPHSGLRVPHFYQCWRLQTTRTQRLEQAIVSTARSVLHQKI